MKKSGKWVVDSDITIDYKNMRINFTNELKLFGKKYVLALFGASVVICMTMFLVCYMINVDVLQAWWSFPCLIAFLFVYLIVTEMPLASGSQFWRNFYFKIKTKKPKRQVTIQNPDTKIEYLTKSSNPLVDLEYDEDIRKKLTTTEMKKIIVKKRWKFRWTLTMLTINLSGKTKGELVIKEY